ncbi:MAG: DUF4065 domain-containing protein [Clostridioides difficile]|nr:DUF4065 domain-containing protein [Clostridioides difficile]
MHTALDIARYIINRCIDLGRPVSNLQLQKILYYVQGEYMKKKNGEPLFIDDIEAWQYGPVVPDVYYSYNIYSASDIVIRQKQPELLESDMKLVDNIIEKKSKISAWDLVTATHSEQPWITVYRENRKEIIPKNLIYSYFLQE